MRASIAHALVAALACGCSSPASGSDAATTVPGDGATLDAGRPDDAGRLVDAGTDAGPLLGTRFALRDGRDIVGELVATYDHSVFWHDPSPELTFAVYRDDWYAPYPDDRSVTFVSSLDVLEQAPVALAARPFRDAMRARSFVLGRPPLDGVSFVITGSESYHLEEDGYGQFALDVVRTGADGLAYTGAGLANEDYLAFGQPVYLPTGGVVVEVVRDAPDNVPGMLDLTAVNNLVGIHLGGGYYLYLLHFRQSTIAADVVVGATLEAGHYLGDVGNAGVSTAPHVHVAFLALEPASAPLRTWSVPVELANVYTSRSMTAPATRADYATVSGGTWISASPF